MGFEVNNLVAVPTERYQQLIRAEHDADMLKAFLVKKYENYGTICRAEIEMFYTIFIGEKENENV